MKNFKYFVESVLSSTGINKESYDILISMVQEDKQLAFELHDVLGKIKTKNQKYYIDSWEDDTLEAIEL